MTRAGWRAFTTSADGRRWYVMDLDDAGRAYAFSRNYHDALTFESRKAAALAITGLRFAGVAAP